VRLLSLHLKNTTQKQSYKPLEKKLHAIFAEQICESASFSGLQHSEGMQQESEVPNKAILPYLSLIFSFIFLSTSVIHKFTMETI
jgi:hypothetical protein